jgi:hypothetical protein
VALGVGGLDGLELRFGRIVPLEVVALVEAGRGGSRRRGGRHGRRARRLAAEIFPGEKNGIFPLLWILKRERGKRGGTVFKCKTD